MANNNNDDIDMTDDLSDDDLLDADLDSFDDENFDDENWEEPVQNQPVKKKSSLFTILLIGTAVVIGGGILFFQLVQSPAPAPDAAQVAQAPDAVPATPAPANDLMAIQDAPPIPDANIAAPAPAQPQGGFMNNPAELEQSLNQAQTGVTAPPSQEMSLQTIDQAAPIAPTINQTTGSNEALPVPQTLPSIDQIKKAPTVQAETLAPAPEVAAPAIQPTPVQETPPVAAQNTTSTSTPVATAPADAALNAKLDQVMTRLDALEKNQSSGVAASSPDLTRLTAALTRLENKVDQLSSSRPSTPSAASYEDDAPIKVTPKPRARPVKKKEPAYSPPKKSDNWVLRSARPGEAMVAKDGQADLKTIRVGDSVVGIGQIQSISQIGGAWVVQGTSGRISQ